MGFEIVARQAFDERIIMLITQQLPKSWKELRESPVIMGRVKSTRTLAKYLEYLKQTGLIKRRVDEKRTSRDKLVYIRTEVQQARRPEQVTMLLRSDLHCFSPRHTLSLHRLPALRP